MGVGGVGAVLLKKGLEHFLPAQYAQYSNYAGLGVSILLLGFTKNKMVQNAAAGAGVVSAYNIVSDLADGQGAGVHLLPPGVPSVRIAGVPQPVAQSSVVTL